jgi:LmbE family N-acetylglucosaminyl deacetylase
VPDVVMIAAPHPDDEVLGCGGSIACHADAGRQVFVLYLSSGERGCPDCPPANARALREQEAAQAMETLGIPAC